MWLLPIMAAASIQTAIWTPPPKPHDGFQLASVHVGVRGPGHLSRTAASSAAPPPPAAGQFFFPTGSELLRAMIAFD